MYNVVLIAAVQQSDWVIYRYMHTCLFIFFFIMAYHSIEYSFLCYTVGTVFAHSINIYTSLHLLSPNSRSIPVLLPLLLGNHPSLLNVPDSFSVS